MSGGEEGNLFTFPLLCRCECRQDGKLNTESSVSFIWSTDGLNGIELNESPLLTECSLFYL